jgi:hypothetical protein
MKIGKIGDEEMLTFDQKKVLKIGMNLCIFLSLLRFTLYLLYIHTKVCLLFYCITNTD